MSRRASVRDDGWRLPDALWAEMEPLLPARPAAPFGLPQPAGAGPECHGRDLLRAAHRLPVERAECDRHLLLVLGASPLPGVDAGRGVRDVLAPGPPGL